MTKTHIVKTSGGSFLAHESDYGGRAQFTTDENDAARFDEATEKATAAAYGATAVPFFDTCIEHGPGGTVRLSFQVRVF